MLPHMRGVALDVGTSSARARVFDAMGRAQAGAEGHVAYEPTTSADGGVELDPGDLMEAVASALDRCLAGAGVRAGDVAAVGVSVFWHSLLALDRDGRPLPPAPRTHAAAGPGVRGGWAARWPALAGVPGHPAGGDGACSNVGSDCWGPGRIALNGGTSAALRGALPEPLGPHPATPWGLWRYRIDATRALVGGATSEGGNVPAWVRKVLALRAGEAALEPAISAVPPAGHHLTALPFVAAERSPGCRPHPPPP